MFFQRAKCTHCGAKLPKSRTTLQQCERCLPDHVVQLACDWYGVGPEHCLRAIDAFRRQSSAAVLVDFLNLIMLQAEALGEPTEYLHDVDIDTVKLTDLIRIADRYHCGLALVPYNRPGKGEDPFVYAGRFVEALEQSQATKPEKSHD